ncbi:MAG: phenylalanine--tRNA ligase subunit beta, partial [Planctomycetota bacterium]
VDGQDSSFNLGVFGIVGEHARKLAGLDEHVVAAELDLDALLGLYPPRGRVEALPAFPAIERDLSLILDEAVPWAKVVDLIESAEPDHFDGVDFVGAFRGKQVGAGKKSLTARLRFRLDSGTLRHEDVDPQVERVVQLATEKLEATLRA